MRLRKLDPYVIHVKRLSVVRYVSAAAYKNMHEDCQTVMPVGDVSVHRVRHRDYDLHQSEGLAGFHLPLHAGVPELVFRIQHQL